jgi:AraC family transcriptional regulator of adaptative response/methylated-DNA-[protein]-cysteine methyltransferase
MTQQEIDFKRISEAIHYLSTRYKNPPSLEEVAEHVHLSPFHFQRMFHHWAGVSPKQFVQYLRIGEAKKILQDTRLTLFDAAFEAGLSGTGRLHDLFVQIEGMTPGEYRNGGASLSILYSFAETLFGKLIVASTARGICHMAFVDRGEQEGLEALVSRFPRAVFRPGSDSMQENALHVFRQDWVQLENIKLHLKGSDFQLKVWEALLRVPSGGLTTYSDLAKQAGLGKAFRALGTAVGKNPVAYLIPCHRVIKSTGAFGNYYWGEPRKNALIGWELSKV